MAAILRADARIAAIHHVPPYFLPGFPDARRVRAKSRYPGGIRVRWIMPDGKILEWDYLHGAVEAYDARGRHTGEFDPATGARIGRATPGRRVEP